jgi:hypothetical protein
MNPNGPALASYPTVANIIIGDLQSEMIEKLQSYVEIMTLGEQVSMPEDEYDLLIEYLDMENHPLSIKLASLWDKEIPGNLLAFFKNLPEPGQA